MSTDQNVKDLFQEVKVDPIVVVPITKAVQEQLRQQYEDRSFSDNGVKNSISISSEYSFSDVHVQKSPLTQEQAYAYILKNHYKTPMKNYSYQDPDTGMINCYEYSLNNDNNRTFGII